MLNKKICILGLGYIGLPTAALLANRGYKVHGVDIIKHTIDIINKGEIHIVEPELDTFVKAAVHSGNLKASLTPCVADVFIIAVPTPFKDNHEPDLSHVIAATTSIAPFINNGAIIILESTSPIGTTQLIHDILKEKKINTDTLYIAHCPERVLPGHIMKELVENDRIVGGLTPEATTKVTELYKTFVEGEVYQTDANTAEMAKLTENSFRDVNIAFANELSILCDKFNINVNELITLTNRHPRVNVLQPGAGVGGHCIAVDPWFLVHSGKSDAKIIRAAREVNTYKTEWVINKIKSKTIEFEKKHQRKPKVACLGLAFKPDIDDLRESPALYITKKLQADGLSILAVEPNIKTYPGLTLTSLSQATEEADIIVALVKHKEFKGLSITEGLDFCGIISLDRRVT